MANKKLWLGMLVIALTFGMTVVGCDDGSGGSGKEADVWLDVTSLSQLNGTWKGSFSYSGTMRGYYSEMFGITDEEWASSGINEIYGNDTRVTINQEYVITFNADAKTMSTSTKATTKYSGSNIDSIWSYYKDLYELLEEESEEEYTVNVSDNEMTVTINSSGMSGTATWTRNSSNHSITQTSTISQTQTLDNDDIAEIFLSIYQINQNGTKIKMSSGGGGLEVILKKQ
jgi:hypothetical protein